MGVLDRLLSPARAEWGPADDRWYAPMAGDTQAGPPVSAETAMRSTAVYGSVRLRAETLGMLPLLFYARRPDGGKDRVPQHPLYRLLHTQPNGWQTATDFWEMASGHLDLRGAFYAEIITGPSGAVQQLVPLHPDRVKVVQLDSGRLTFEHTHNRTGVRRNLSQEEMFWVFAPMGVSPLTAAREAIGLSLAAEQHGAALFRHGARPLGVLKQPAGMKLDREAKERLRDSWNATYAGAKNTGKVVILEEGLEYQALGLSNEDSQWLENRKFQVVEIARVFRVPPHMIADLERATYSNIEEQAIEFVVFMLGPVAHRIEQAIHRCLLNETEQEQYAAEFLMEGLLRGNTASRYAAYASGIVNGWLTRNEARLRENLNPLDGLDEPLSPLNMRQGANAPQDNRPPPASQARHGAPTVAATPPPLLEPEPAAAPEAAAGRVTRAEIKKLTKLWERLRGDEAAWEAAVDDLYAPEGKHAAWVATVMGWEPGHARAWCSAHCMLVIEQGLAALIPFAGGTPVPQPEDSP